ncbi:MAG: hypothetical protein AB7E04_02910 [Desulfobacteraceae bacterium]|jgi:hypothetical protein
MKLNENGAAMFLVVMILVLLTIIGFAAVSDSVFNLKISSIIKRSSSETYLCESFAAQGAACIESEKTDRLRDFELDWVYSSSCKVIEELGLEGKKAKYFKDSDINKIFCPPSDTPVDYKNLNPSEEKKAKIAAFYNGLSETGSQDIGSGDCVHDYTVISRFETYKDTSQLDLDSVKTVEIGLRRKF